MGSAPNNKNKRWQGKRKHDTKISKYISRQQALKKVQLPLSRFREMCILRGVSPRIPPWDKRSNKVYYLTEDIRQLNSDPLVQKFREWRVFMLRLRKLHDKKEFAKEKNFLQNAKPRFTYDHLIKYRYVAHCALTHPHPLTIFCFRYRYSTFQSALADLDDCLTLVFLFSKMPTGNGIESKLIQKAKRLTDEFATYVAQTNSLRKVFLSIKGIYYQATIMGQDVTWVVPYDFAQTVREKKIKIFSNPIFFKKHTGF